VRPMRVKWMALNVTLSTCLICAPAFADSHSRPVVATPHVQSHGAQSHSAQSHSAAARTTTTGQPAHVAKTHSTSPSAPISTSTPTPTKPSTALNPIAAKIASKPQLNTRITAMLPKGMTLNQASTGFRNQGQFIAALHVSQNLGCDCFKQIKADMTVKHMSLGQSIQDVKKTANTTVEVNRAETEANLDVKSAVTTTTATSALTSTGTNSAKNAKKTTPTRSDR